MLDTKQRIPLYFFSIILSVLIYFLFFSPKFLQSNPDYTSMAPAHPQLEKWIDQKSEPIIKNYVKTLEDLQQGKPKIKKTSTDTIEADIKIARFSFQSMDHLRSHINKDQIRKRILDDLLQNSEILQLATPILTDEEFRRKYFAEDQAIARIYTISLLRQLADEGNREPLEKITQKLSLKLSTQAQVSPGEWRDLEDLIIHIIESRGAQNMVKNLGDLLANLAYSERIKEAFANALYFAFRNILENQEIEKLLP